ncbi:unnamed protein product [Adineta ricciae]|uniref:Uncharacterized protein n=1 Tax=Adineta ricciae TaxID=249248 RepID=A0A815Q2I5_ADIRI|nr:unnamed protein product [Adineta ricciae]CAF1457714.1 unnamed protein product [Adineta ricciae]
MLWEKLNFNGKPCFIIIDKNLLEKSSNLVYSLSDKTTNEIEKENFISSRESQPTNFLVIWLNLTLNGFNDEIDDSILIFTNLDEFIDFTTEIENDKIVLILSSLIDENLLFIIEDIPQIYSIYFHCNQRINYHKSRKSKDFTLK